MTAGSSEGAGATATRRHHYRVDCDLAVEYAVEGEGRTGVARLLNLGLGGARLEFPEPLEQPASVSITIRDGAAFGGAGDPAPLTLVGRAVWAVSDDAGGPYPAGLQFGETDDDVRRRLSQVVRGLLGDDVTDASTV